jgi:hypothetical protein
MDERSSKGLNMNLEGSRCFFGKLRGSSELVSKFGVRGLSVRLKG